jgi:hypothetical protein
MELGYDKSASVNSTTSYANPVFNGNIAGTIWKSAGDRVARKYDFSYDNVNRFVKADFNQNSSGSAWDHNTINYSVYGFDESNGFQMTYDANGNILTMIQQGFKVGGSNIVDALAYTYQPNSNKLQQVWDYLNDPTSRLGDFHYKNETKQATDYAYDGNGNLTLDNNKAISGII